MAIVVERDGPGCAGFPPWLGSVRYPGGGSVREGRDFAGCVHTFRHIADNFINKISKVEHEVELFVFRCVHIVGNQSCPCTVIAALKILAGCEGIADGPFAIRCGCCARATSVWAHLTIGDEAIKIAAVRHEAVHQHAGCEIARRIEGQLPLHDEGPECIVKRHLASNADIACRHVRCGADPEHDGVWLRITGREPLREAGGVHLKRLRAGGRERQGCRERKTARDGSEALKERASV